MNTENTTKVEATTDNDVLDLFELVGELWRKIWLILLSFVIGAVIAGSVSHFFITPQYKATSMIYVYSKTTSITSLADLQLGSQLAVDFQIVSTTREVINNVITKLNLNTTYEELLETITVTNPASSHILKIQVTNPDPAMSAEICNTLADELRMRIADVMNTDAPSVVDRAVVPTEKASPSLVKNSALGGILTMLVAVVVICVMFLMDDTIKNEDDVTRYLGLNVLAEIPLEHTGKSAKRSKKIY